MTRVALAGYGFAGRDIHAPVLGEAGCEVVAVSTRNPERAAAARDDIPGVEVVPVPVYYPETTTILGQPVVRKIVDAGAIDLVDVFRRPKDVAGHLDDLLAARPPAVWLQSGIRNDEVAEALAKAGIKVVQDRCLMVEHRRFA